MDNVVTKLRNLKFVIKHEEFVLNRKQVESGMFLRMRRFVNGVSCCSVWMLKVLVVRSQKIMTVPAI